VALRIGAQPCAQACGGAVEPFPSSRGGDNRCAPGALNESAERFAAPAELRAQNVRREASGNT
jgi:hypothetical protein